MALVAASGAACAAPKLKVIHSFQGLKGAEPYAGLTADAAGNLFGVTSNGGSSQDGVVFELSPSLDGRKGWTETVIHRFNGAGGGAPYGGLIMDASGDLFGTASGGGANGDGVVFELKPPQRGHKAWIYGVLYQFSREAGRFPRSALLADGAGNLYGTTVNGGQSNSGVAFELSPPPAGQGPWTETTIYRFDRPSGEHPLAGLIADSKGNLYGTTSSGGQNQTYGGVVFELSPPVAGNTHWTAATIYYFTATNNKFLNGKSPAAGLIIDGAGNLYGTTPDGGANNAGVVFELSPPTQGQLNWTEAVLYSFSGPDGSSPQAGLLSDAAGNLYGTTSGGGANGLGVAFELSPPVSGQTTWTEKVLASFQGTDGANPQAGLISDGAHGFYGTTEGGGHSDEGVAFHLKP